MAALVDPEGERGPVGSPEHPRPDALAIADARETPAEVRRVHVGERRLTVEGALPGAAADGSARIVCRVRGGVDALSAPATTSEDGFRAEVDLAALAAAAGDVHVWDLYLEPGDGRPALRLGAHLDDVREKKTAVVFPQRTLRRDGVERTVRPYYTEANDLSVRVTTVGLPQPPADRRRDARHAQPGLAPGRVASAP